MVSPYWRFLAKASLKKTCAPKMLGMLVPFAVKTNQRKAERLLYSKDGSKTMNMLHMWKEEVVPYDTTVSTRLIDSLRNSCKRQCVGIRVIITLQFKLIVPNNWTLAFPTWELNLPLHLIDFKNLNETSGENSLSHLIFLLKFSLRLFKKGYATAGYQCYRFPLI